MATTNTMYRLSFIMIILMLVVFNRQAIAGNNQDKDDLPSLNGKKILMVWGGWKGHEPKEFTDKVKPRLENMGASVTVSDSLGICTNKELMQTFDLIIQSWTMGKISKEQEQGLLNAVRNGAGLRSEEHTSELQSRPHLVCR